MNAAGRLTAYAAGLAIAFAGAFGIAAVAVPRSVVTGWEGKTDMNDRHTMAHEESSTAPAGLSASAGGYLLTDVSAPGTTGQPGELDFRIHDEAGRPLLDYTASHDKDLHLIVVRSDGTHFRHVHPTLDRATGTWSVPWRWDAAGTYRVYTDFTPAAGKDAANVTLTSSVDVAGDLAPAAAPAVRTTSVVDGFSVALSGRLTAGTTGELTATVTRDGRPVTALEPYLGAYGHLVALRQGDLAYLHVHPQGAEPGPGDRGGPRIAFAAQAPTAGRYLLYLDFQVGGQVHTATFVLDAARGGAGTTHDTDSHGH